MSTCLRLFYAYKLGNHVHCTFIFTFLYSCFFRVFFCTVIYKVLLSNTNNYMVSSNYSNLIIAICLHTIIWLQGTNNNNP